jgi:hypothetical protein
VEEFCRVKGIIHQKTNPYSSQENGIAERLNRVLMEKARSMLEDASLEMKYWGEAVMTANYIRNRTISSVHGKTPFELFTGEKPSVDHLRVFGSKVFSHVPAQKRKKLDPMAEEGLFLGYEPRTKGYRILRASDGRVVVSKDVTFKEEAISSAVSLFEDQERDPCKTVTADQSTVSEGEGSRETLDELGGARDLSRVSPLVSPGAGATPTGEASTSDDPEQESNEREGRQEAVQARSRRARKPSSLYPESEWIKANVARETSKRLEPQTYEEALGGEDFELWQKAMEDKMASLLENKTWEIETVPEGVKPVPVKWVYKIKTDANGNVERYKARVCAKGFRQKQGIDFEEVFAPVSRQPTVRALLSVAAVQNLEVEQLDVKTAFLNGDLEEDVWMEQPAGYTEGGPEKACHLRKALYGLKQAPRAWHLKLTSEMEKIGFNPALFVKKTEGEPVYAAVWIDDCLIAGTEKQVKDTKKAIGDVIQIRDLGPVRFFLGMEIEQDRSARKLKLTQKKAIRELLEEFKMTSAKPRAVPMGTGEKPTREGESIEKEKFSYSTVVGSLLYLSNCTRPDIAHANGVLFRYMSKPTTDHWRMAKGVLRYLAGTPEVGIEFGGEKLDLVGFCDADWAGDIDNRRSTTGYVFTLGGGVVSWASKVQATVACSTTEAEYMAAAFATREALWLRKLGGDLDLGLGAVNIQCNNQGAIKLVKHPIATQRSKHIDIQHHFVQERVMRKEVKFEYCETNRNAADLLTKAVTMDKFELCRQTIGMC